MMIHNKFKEYLEKSVLCWLATSNGENEPNVSPKEMFVLQDDRSILIANIASPGSVENIEANPQVCVSFIDILVQKGYKIKGKARNVYKDDPDFLDKKLILIEKFSDLYPIQSIIEVNIDSVEAIIAPSYFLFPESTTEESQIEAAKRSYKMDDKK